MEYHRDQRCNFPFIKSTCVSSPTSSLIWTKKEREMFAALQVHSLPSHEGGAQCVDPTLM
jgi:hypothetical protein